MISAFGVEHPDPVSKRVGAKTVKPFQDLWDKAKFGNASGMFGPRYHKQGFKAPKKKAYTDEKTGISYPEREAHKMPKSFHKKELPSAFEVGMHRGWTRGYGPMRSAALGLQTAAAHSPGTAAVAGTGAVGALGGGAYVAGRSMKSDKKTDG